MLIFLCNHASFIRNLRTAQTILMDFRFEIVIWIISNDHNILNNGHNNFLNVRNRRDGQTEIQNGWIRWMDGQRNIPQFWMCLTDSWLILSNQTFRIRQKREVKLKLCFENGVFALRIPYVIWKHALNSFEKAKTDKQAT